tara:strand:- start:142 stop:603 length:462 start_codon:yes stop_codon:yes gene_type:complete
MKIMFLHGLESKPGGSKPTYLSYHGHTVLNPSLPKDSWDDSVKIARALFEQELPDVVVGSSRGGAVAIAARLSVPKLVLVAPAWAKYCPWGTIPSTATILHSKSDDIVPYSDSELLAHTFGAELIETGADHRMNDEFALEKMLEVINRGQNLS